MDLYIGVTLMLVLVLAEIVYLVLFRGEEVPYQEVVSNLNSGHILLWLFRGLEIIGYHYALQFLSLDVLSGWPVWLQWVFAFVAWDFCFYWLHRIHHQLPSLWSVHVVHHEGEHFSLSLGIRNSWFSSLTSLPFFLPLALIGVPLEQFILVGSINYFVQFYNHNHIVKRSGWLEHVLITPSHHRVHHGHDDIYRNRNFGGTLVLWDKLFGTFQAELPELAPTFGVSYVPSHNPFRLNLAPVLRVLPRTWGRRLEQAWRRVHAPRRTFHTPQIIVLMGGLVAFALLAVYVYHEPVWTSKQLSWLFAYTFGSTLGMGGVLEGQRWGLWLWGVLALAGMLGVIAFGLLASAPLLSVCLIGMTVLAACSVSRRVPLSTTGESAG